MRRRIAPADIPQRLSFVGATLCSCKCLPARISGRWHDTRHTGKKEQSLTRWPAACWAQDQGAHVSLHCWCLSCTARALWICLVTCCSAASGGSRHDATGCRALSCTARARAYSWTSELVATASCDSSGDTATCMTEESAACGEMQAHDQGLTSVRPLSSTEAAEQRTAAYGHFIRAAAAQSTSSCAMSELFEGLISSMESNWSVQLQQDHLLNPLQLNVGSADCVRVRGGQGSAQQDSHINAGHDPGWSLGASDRPCPLQLSTHRTKKSLHSSTDAIA